MRALPVARLMRPPFEWFARAVLREWCPLTVEGRQHLPPLPFIICSNHNSHMDCVALMAAARYPFRQFAILAASDYSFRNAIVFNCFSAMITLIPVDRTASPENFRRSLEMCREFVSGEPRALILFPEGTRSRSGLMGPFRRGASAFADELALPVVPACVTGTREALPIGSFLPRPRAVCVRFARPLYPSENHESTRRERILDSARERIVTLEAAAHEP